MFRFQHAIYLALAVIFAGLYPTITRASSSEQSVISTTSARQPELYDATAQPTRAEAATVLSIRAARLFEVRNRALTACLARLPKPAEANCIVEGIDAGRAATRAYDGFLQRIGSVPYDIDDAARTVSRATEQAERSKCVAGNALCRAQAKWIAEQASDEERSRLLKAGSGPVAWAQPRTALMFAAEEEADDSLSGTSPFFRNRPTADPLSRPPVQLPPPQQQANANGCRTIDTSSETRDPTTGAITTSRGRSTLCGSDGSETARRAQEMLDDVRR